MRLADHYIADRGSGELGLVPGGTALLIRNAADDDGAARRRERVDYRFDRGGCERGTGRECRSRRDWMTAPVPTVVDVDIHVVIAIDVDVVDVRLVDIRVVDVRFVDVGVVDAGAVDAGVAEVPVDARTSSPSISAG